MWNLKYDIKELIDETEIDSETQRTDLWFPEGRGGGGQGWIGSSGFAGASCYI